MEYIAEALEEKDAEDRQQDRARLGKLRASGISCRVSCPRLCSDDAIQLRNDLLSILLAARDATAGLLSSVSYVLHSNLRA